MIFSQYLKNIDKNEIDFKEKNNENTENKEKLYIGKINDSNQNQITKKEMWLLEAFSNNLFQIIYNFFQKNIALKNEIQEIRIRANRPIIIRLQNKDIILQHNVTQAEIIQTVERLCENSIYAYKNEICDGFITIKGGHRIGITGTCVIENGKIINVKYISSLNFRMAREVIDCSNKFLKEIIDLKNKDIYNTIIVAPPGKGKTTVLRDIIRKISNGIEEINFPGKNIRHC